MAAPFSSLDGPGTTAQRSAPGQRHSFHGVGRGAMTHAARVVSNSRLRRRRAICNGRFVTHDQCTTQ